MQVKVVDDHDQVLPIWRREKISGLPLVHVDAHSDFDFYRAFPPEEIVSASPDLRSLKRRLEYSIAFRRYHDTYESQRTIGNYVYPAMKEGMVSAFYWVVPGNKTQFRRSRGLITRMVRSLHRRDPFRKPGGGHCLFRRGCLITELLGRPFIITTLDCLPRINRTVLLDIDTDFLVISDLKWADPRKEIGRRSCWIKPEELVESLRQRLARIRLVTVAYSVNGGYTPVVLKVLGDEVAWRFAPRSRQRLYRRALAAHRYFSEFLASGSRPAYQRARQLDPVYGCADNSYGWRYVSVRRFSLAAREFRRIASADPFDPRPWAGLGYVALARKQAIRAVAYLSRSRRLLPGSRPVKLVLSGLAQALFLAGRSRKAARLFAALEAEFPGQPETGYFLGRISEQEGDYAKALFAYCRAIQCGFSCEDIYRRAMRIILRHPIGYDTIAFVKRNFRCFARASGLKRTSPLYDLYQNI